MYVVVQLDKLANQDIQQCHYIPMPIIINIMLLLGAKLCMPTRIADGPPIGVEMCAPMFIGVVPIMDVG